jgi:hypothetical protein
MAKKVRRVRRSSAKTDAGQAASSQEVATSTRRDAAERFRQEYAYVLKDLRQILLLAVAMFILLIILNLILQ